MAFKALLTGDINAANSVDDKVGALSRVSSSYTFYSSEGSDIGTVISTTSTGTLQACLDTCDTTATCAVAVITGASQQRTTGTVGCSLRSGVAKQGLYYRSVTRTDTARLDLSSTWLPGETQITAHVWGQRSALSKG